MYQKEFGKEHIYLRTTFIKRISEDELGCEDQPRRGVVVVVIYWRIRYIHCHRINLTVINNNCGSRWEAGYINIKYKVK